MDVYSASRPSPHFETKASGSEFETEAYLEYRRFVYMLRIFLQFLNFFVGMERFP